MSAEQDRGPGVKRLLEAAMNHHRGRRQDEFESVLNVEIRIVKKNILRARANVNSKDFHFNSMSFQKCDLSLWENNSHCNIILEAGKLIAPKFNQEK